MKKIIVFLLVSFAFVFKVDASSKFLLGEKLSDIHIEVVQGDKVQSRTPYILTRDDHEIVYCINPFILMNTKEYYNEYDYNDEIFNLSDEQLDKINLISYYGYGYENHTDTKWYAITQFLVWKQLNYDDIYFTDTEYGNKIVKYEKEINEIEQLVDNYYKLPSFANKTMEYSSNRTYKLKDTNNVLKNYELLDSDIDLNIINNELIINTKNDGEYTIRFIKKSPAINDYKLYNLSLAQALIYPGKLKDIIFSLTIEVNSGSIKINKIDSENKDRVEATLKGATYGIYDDKELITTVETNENGVAHIDELPMGNYYIKEISPSKGYLLDNNVYNVSLTKKNKNIIINSYEKIKKGTLIINKYYGKENNYKLEDEAVFEVYDKNQTLVTTLKTENGIIKENLPYGNYYIVQKEGKKGYNYVDSFNVFIDEEKEYEFNLYDELLIVEVPNTGIYKNKYNIFSLTFICIGSLIIILNKVITKKTTN